MKNRVEVMHGVNFDVLGRRDPRHYGGMSLTELEVRVKRFARELGLEATFSQTNHEGEFCESLHRAAEGADGLLLNPGAWTHYSYAIHDALEAVGVPKVEVHLSNVHKREEWRRRSVVSPAVDAVVAGMGADGYRVALDHILSRSGRQ
ncbi:MAG: 3-dehydroquinate dehydratase [Actinomycetota bacterium]|nr:3-dehydroquinate dehydratase [Actinomycetota bacterium]